ncbi:unnamed protein product, partial [Dovyalis caffra]
FERDEWGSVDGAAVGTRATTNGVGAVSDCVVDMDHMVKHGWAWGNVGLAVKGKPIGRGVWGSVGTWNEWNGMEAAVYVGYVLQYMNGME